MKRLLHILVPAVVVLLLTACQKEESLELGTNDPGTGGPGTGDPGGGGGGGGSATYYLECKIAGQAKTFNFDLGVERDEDENSGEIATTITGFAKEDISDNEAFILMIQTSGELTTGTYGVTNVTGTLVLAGYQPSGADIAPFMTSTGLTMGTPFSIVVTKATSTEVEGTFGGTLFEIDLSDDPDIPGPTTPTKLVTDGKFRVKY
jgi:hypothetical protein